MLSSTCATSKTPRNVQTHNIESYKIAQITFPKDYETYAHSIKELKGLAH